MSAARSRLKAKKQDWEKRADVLAARSKDLGELRRKRDAGETLPDDAMPKPVAAAPTMADVRALAGLPPTSGLELAARRKWRALTSARPQKSADFLKEAGQFVFWPCFVDQVHAGGHKKGQARVRRAVYRAVIPGLLFVAQHLSAGDPVDFVHVAPGVTGFLRGSDGHAADLTEQDITIIRHIEAGLNLPYDPKTAHKFRPGDSVRFVDDIYSRWPPGTVRRLAEDGRIVVEVALLGRITPILVYPNQIEAM
jgi:transcription antitermination factor NusG